VSRQRRRWTMQSAISWKTQPFDQLVKDQGAAIKSVNASIAGSTVRYVFGTATAELLLEPDGRWAEVIGHCPSEVVISDWHS
jgi:hypothetical protein